MSEAITYRDGQGMGGVFISVVGSNESMHGSIEIGGGAYRILTTTIVFEISDIRAATRTVIGEVYIHIFMFCSTDTF